MTETLAVVALDAADYELARRWECENVLLDQHGPLETFSYSHSQPFTPEVWTTVATGLHPREHEISHDAADWDSLPLRLASNVTQYLPHEWRSLLGQPFRERGHEQQIHVTDAPHAFEDGVVFGWPGISEADHLSQAWKWASDVQHGELTEHELQDKTVGNTGKEFGWLVAMDELDEPIAGVHSHVLDLTGHAFASRESGLRPYYEHVDSMLGWLREEVDELVVLSDHGMQVSWLDDPEPGTHSGRAVVAATDGVTGELPESVFEVREWLEANTAAADSDPTIEETASMDTAEERLRELGYLD